MVGRLGGVINQTPLLHTERVNVGRSKETGKLRVHRSKEVRVRTLKEVLNKDLARFIWAPNSVLLGISECVNCLMVD